MVPKEVKPNVEDRDGNLSGLAGPQSVAKVVVIRCVMKLADDS